VVILTIVPGLGALYWLHLGTEEVSQKMDASRESFVFRAFWIFTQLMHFPSESSSESELGAAEDNASRLKESRVRRESRAFISNVGML
jgi:hypothetical protein